MLIPYLYGILSPNFRDLFIIDDPCRYLQAPPFTPLHLPSFDVKLEANQSNPSSNR